MNNFILFVGIALFSVGVTLIPTAILDMQCYSKQAQKKVNNIGLVAIFAGLIIIAIAFYRR